MDQNQKFALLVFGLVLLAVVIGVWYAVIGSVNGML